MSTAVARNLMSDMKLLRMLEAFERIVAEATRGQVSYTEFLDALLQAKADSRGERAAKRRLKAAKLPLRISLEDFDYSAHRSITKAQIRELQNPGCLREGRPLLLIAQAGVGKSFLAHAIGLQAFQHGKTVLYMTVTTWLETLAMARSSRTYLRLREKLEERSIGKSTVFTTQLPLDHWSEVIADPVIADAIRNRPQHAALIITITGESYRGVKARKLAGGGKAG